MLFDNVYQGGPSVEVFGTSGSNPIENWKVSGAVHKVYDKQVRGYIFACAGGPSIRMQLPKDDRRSLGLVQPFIVLQLFLAEDKGFSLAIQVSDAAHGRHRLLFSTSVREAVTTPLHARIPLGGIPRGVWLSLVLDVAGLVAHIFGAKFARLDTITLGSSCKLRRICTLRDAPAFTASDGAIDTDLNCLALRSFELPPGVPAATHVFTVDDMLAAAPSDPSRSSARHGTEHVMSHGGNLPPSSPIGPTPPLGSSLPSRGATVGALCGPASSGMSHRLPPPLQMQHTRGASAHDVLNRHASPATTRRPAALNGCAASSASPGGCLAQPPSQFPPSRRSERPPEPRASGDATQGLQALHSRRHSRREAAAGWSCETRRPGAAGLDSPTAPQLEIGGEPAFFLSDGAADAPTGSQGSASSSLQLRRQYSELQQRRQRIRQLEGSFERQYGEVGCAAHSLAHGVHPCEPPQAPSEPLATETETNRSTRSLPQRSCGVGRDMDELSSRSRREGAEAAPRATPAGHEAQSPSPKGYDKLEAAPTPPALPPASGGLRNHERRPASLAALKPERLSSSAAAISAPIGAVSLAQCGRRNSGNSLLPSLRIDTTIGDEARADSLAEPRTTANSPASSSTPPLAFSPEGSSFPRCGTGLGGLSARPHVPAIVVHTDGGTTSGTARSPLRSPLESPVRSPLWSVLARSRGGACSGAATRSTLAREPPRCATASGRRPAARLSVARSGSGSGADDEAGSDGTGSGSETGSLAAARELGLLGGRRGGHGGTHSSFSGLSAHTIDSEDDEVRTSMADSEDSREDPFGGCGEDGHGLAEGGHAFPVSLPAASVAVAAGASNTAPAHRAAPPRPPPSDSAPRYSVSPVSPSSRLYDSPAADPTGDGPAASLPSLATPPSRARMAPSYTQQLHSGAATSGAPFVAEPPGFGSGSAYNPAAYVDEQARRSERVLGGRLRNMTSHASSPTPLCSGAPSAAPGGALVDVGGRTPETCWSPRSCAHAPEIAPADTGAARARHLQGDPPSLPNQSGQKNYSSSPNPPSLITRPSLICQPPRSASEAIKYGTASEVSATMSQAPSCEWEEDAEYSAHFGSSINGAMDGRTFTPPVCSPTR